MTMGLTENAHGLEYCVDLVMCVDATGSMGQVVDIIKAGARELYQEFIYEMAQKSKRVKQLRIKVIAFRDYGFDPEPMLVSKFFVLPYEQRKFETFVNSIEATGGGDDAENVLEDLALAMKSDWTREGGVRRHVIIMYTDAPALKLGERAECAGYPTDLPKDLAELQGLWEGQYMEKRAKNMLIWAPDVYPWPDIAGWNQVLHYPADAECVCDDWDIQTCIHLLVNSI